MTATRDRQSDASIKDDGSGAPNAVTWDQRPAFGRYRGLPWWGAVLLAFGVAIVAAIVNLQIDDSLGWVFQGCYLVGCVVAVGWVQRRSLFGPMVQPPLVLAVVIPLIVLFVSGPPSGSDLFSQALAIGTPLINGFPAMAITTGITVLIGVLRVYRERGPTGAAQAKTPSAARSGKTAKSKPGKAKPGKPGRDKAGKSKAGKAGTGNAGASTDKAQSGSAEAEPGAAGVAGTGRARPGNQRSGADDRRKPARPARGERGGGSGPQRRPEAGQAPKGANPRKGNSGETPPPGAKQQPPDRQQPSERRRRRARPDDAAHEQPRRGRPREQRPEQGKGGGDKARGDKSRGEPGQDPRRNRQQPRTPGRGQPPPQGGRPRKPRPPEGPAR